MFDMFYAYNNHLSIIVSIKKKCLLFNYCLKNKVQLYV